MRARRRLLGLLGVLLSSLSSAVGLPWATLLGAAGCPWGHLRVLFGDLLGAPGVLRGWFFGGAGFSFHALSRLLLSFLLLSKTHQVLRWLCQDSTAPDTDQQYKAIYNKNSGPIFFSRCDSPFFDAGASPRTPRRDFRRLVVPFFLAAVAPATKIHTSYIGQYVWQRARAGRQCAGGGREARFI